ncbi:penicillin acylase family protein [Massilia sp. Root335]|uniref:penicillin acylase family protein n=1 Tax=Massilia sp. Root335 TaxID=1736517 RepID=UPI000A5EBB71|nr:penicillin acylase family protein [Massilia sp. Root335]
MTMSRPSPVAVACAALFALAQPALAEAPAPVAATVRAAFAPAELARMRATARRVTIMRDKWGIPHVFGKTDADAVFGMLFAQAEDDFNRVELNYINALGRLAEVEGEQEIWRDLRMKLYIDPADLKAKYAASPAWLKTLMDAYADGLNWYLVTHPQVKPKLLVRFEPWMALAFSEGSIGGDIETIDLKGLEAFYGRQMAAPVALADLVDLGGAGKGFDPEPQGSNGFAVAPRRTAGGHALLLINPHTSFYFRPEIHMVSEEGLNAYGAVTWGQFFIYQGFNDRIGWMHTSGGGDVIDEYLETVTRRDGTCVYKYGTAERTVREKTITLPYRTAHGLATRTVTAYFTHHGPVIRAQDGKWVAVRMMADPVHALMQSYGRTKARDYAAFYKVMALRTNSSNNTVYADADGNIAYFHGNFIPRRDPRFDWTKPVDGSDPATEWHGLHDVKETITVFNPESGYVSNTNNWPCTGFGASSPDCSAYPRYMWSLPQNPRGIHAERVLHDAHELTLDGLIAKAYDSYLTAFEPLVPSVVKDWDALPDGAPLKARLAGQVALLRGWDLRFSTASVATSLAVYWGQDMVREASARAKAQGMPVIDFVQTALHPQERLDALARASDKLQADFGSWKTPWGEINRFQRLSGAVDQQYDDARPSLPVGFTSANWGSLASFGMTARQTTKRIYGDRGNSFVAAVEFGPHVRAKSILAGGESGDPASPHFTDQAAMYSRGEFKDVLYTRADIEKHLERKYHPGE